MTIKSRHKTIRDTESYAGVFADTTTLKSVDISVIPNFAIAYVETDGEYFYDSSATDTESLPNIVSPSVGTGRWFKKDGYGSGVNVKSSMKYLDDTAFVNAIIFG
jgi:hypothetical protein